MKAQILVSAAIALVSMNAFGAVSKWSGTGAAYSPDGVQLGTYDISVVNTDFPGNLVQSETTITASNGEKKIISQKITMNGTSWSDESSLGNGGGACYGKDLCENYISGNDGLDYATTIVIDGADARRNLTVVLQKGKAIKVLRDNLKHLP